MIYKIQKEVKTMLTILFWILMLLVFGKLLLSAMKMAWGITKIILLVVLLPIGLIVLALSGFIQIALPILIIVGLIALFFKW